MGLARSRITQLVQSGMPTAPDGRIIEARARQWIEKNLDRHRRDARKSASDAGSVTDLRAAKLQREAALLDMELKQRSGQVVDRAEAERAVFARARQERDAWMGWASRSAGTLASEAGGDLAITFATLDRLVREHLNELAAAPTRLFDA